MPRVLSEAMNTYTPCLSTLVGKGFRVTADFFDDKPADWYADNGQVRLAASSPVSLLGLAALWESRGESWRKGSEEPDLYHHILEHKSLP
jgi:hypothetical protein